MVSSRRRLVVAVALALAWIPACYMAWVAGPKLLRMFLEFEIHGDPLTFLLLTHCWWLCPVVALVTIALATWRPTTDTVCVSVFAALTLTVSPMLLSLYHLQNLIWQLS